MFRCTVIRRPLRIGRAGMGSLSRLRPPTDWPVLALVAAAGLGGHFVGWNESLLAGFWDLILFMVFLGCGYICLALCSAEMTSTLPFVGGSFGFSRVALGPYIGYSVGWAELIQNVFVTASCVVKVGQILTQLLQSSSAVEYAYWAASIAAIGGLQMAPRRALPAALLLVVGGLLLLFFIGAMARGDFASNSDADQPPFDHFVRDISRLHYASWFFITINFVPVVCGNSPQPKSIIPTAVLGGTGAFLCCSLLVVVAAVAASPGVDALKLSTAPLSHSFTQLLGLSLSAAQTLSLPPLLALAYVVMMALSRQVTSMANSNLLPAVLRGDVGHQARNPVATSVMCVLVFVVLVMLKGVDVNWPSCLFNVAAGASYVVNVSVLASYAVFRKKYDGLEKPFVNGLGVRVAWVGSVVFSLAFVAVVGRLMAIARAAVLVSLLWTLITANYVLAARSAQCFSEEEQKVLFVAYVINANARSRLQRSKSARSLNVHGGSTDGGQNALVRGLYALGRTPSRSNLMLPRSSSSSMLTRDAPSPGFARGPSLMRPPPSPRGISLSRDNSSARLTSEPVSPDPRVSTRLSSVFARSTSRNLAAVGIEPSSDRAPMGEIVAATAPVAPSRRQRRLSRDSDRAPVPQIAEESLFVDSDSFVQRRSALDRSAIVAPADELADKLTSSVAYDSTKTSTSASSSPAHRLGGSHDPRDPRSGSASERASGRRVIVPEQSACNALVDAEDARELSLPARRHPAAGTLRVETLRRGTVGVEEDGAALSPATLQRRRNDRIYRRSMGDVVPPHEKPPPTDPRDVAANPHADAPARPDRRWVRAQRRRSREYQASADSAEGAAATDGTLATSSPGSSWLLSSFSALGSTISKVAPFSEDQDFSAYTEAFVRAVLGGDEEDAARIAAPASPTVTPTTPAPTIPADTQGDGPDRRGEAALPSLLDLMDASAAPSSQPEPLFHRRLAFGVEADLTIPSDMADMPLQIAARRKPAP